MGSGFTLQKQDWHKLIRTTNRITQPPFKLMKEANVALVSLPQANGQLKNRPVIVLKQMPGFGDWLVCGVSTQLHQAVSGFDELITPNDYDFQGSGLKAASVIRLGFLALLPDNQFSGFIGSIAKERHQRLLNTLCRYLCEDA